MKVSVPVIVLFAATASALDIGQLLGQLKPILKKTKCAAPCVSSIVNKLPCEGSPLTTIYTNMDKVMKEAEPCIAKCAIDKSSSGKKPAVERGQAATLTNVSFLGTVVKIIKDMCAKVP
ncbi:hypothetical protein PWT90_00462 [Aphanocladium album]|nr:hypothetical protein PWT90_00462 [Aphanocladium album]